MLVDSFRFQKLPNTKPESVVNNEKNMIGIIEIRFGKSSSSNYLRAIKKAKEFSSFIEAKDDIDLNTITVPADELLNKYKSFQDLIRFIMNWKSSDVIYNGNSIRMYDFFYKFELIVNCSKTCAAATEKTRYCYIDPQKEGWGCRFLTETKRHLEKSYSKGLYWYEFGNFNTDNSEWVIDKFQLNEVLQKEIISKVVYGCPYFSQNKLNTIIENIPNSIKIAVDNKNWDIEYEEDFYGEKIDKKPVGIKHKGLNDNQSSDSLIKISFDGHFKDDNKKEAVVKTRYIPNITFDDIGGIDYIIDQIREIVELPLKRPDLLKHLGIKPHKGILLFGPPGNGKTMIAKAIANEVNAHFIPINGPELFSKWHGESEKNLRDIFEEAREFAPTIIFFDEIDSIAQTRSGDEIARLDSKFVNQLLTLMDGIEIYNNVSVLASTNRPELIDTALLRPGRFDYKLEIKKPDINGCLKILNICTRTMPLGMVDLENLSKKLLGLSGAEISFIVKEAAYNSLRRNMNLIDLIKSDNNDIVDHSNLKITLNDFEIALNKIKEMNETKN